MTENEKFSLTKRAESFTYAFAGWKHLIRTEHNAWVHAVATVIIVPLALWLQISRLEWAVLLLAMLMVWTGEFINTAIEAVVDMTAHGKKPLAKVAKDVAAGAVLLSAVVAVIIGLLILGPPLYDKLF